MTAFAHLCPAQDPPEDFCKFCEGGGRVSDCCGASTVLKADVLSCTCCEQELDEYWTNECKQCQGTGANCE